MRSADSAPVDWHVRPDASIPPEVAAAAAEGLPIVAHLSVGAFIDGWAAELLEECVSVVRYGV